MQGQQQQQAYDRGITIFSPDGRLYQVEYAREAVKRGSASVGVRTDSGVVFAVEKNVRSPLMEHSSVEKVHEIDSHVGVANAGHVADARQLIDFARRQAQVNRLRYDEPVGVESLTKQVTDHIQQYTQVGGARPFGVALIIGGIENGEPRLFETDPSGTPTEWSALAIGSGRDAILDHLEENYESGADLDAGVGLALRALAAADDDTYEPEGVGIATIDVETEQYTDLSTEEVEDHLTEHDLLATDDEDEDDDEDEETDADQEDEE